MFARSRLLPSIVLIGLALAVACAPAAPAQKPAETKPAAEKTEAKPAEKAAKPEAKAAATGSGLKFSIWHTEPDAFTDTEKWWAQQVTEKTQNRVQMQLIFGGALATVTETLNAVKDGSADLGVTAASVLSGQLPAMANFEPLAAYPAEPDKWNAMMDKATPLVKQIFAQGGVQFLWGQPGIGTVADCRQKHLKVPADYQGMKIRAAGRWQGEQMRALGASPVATDPGEVYLALQNGTVDCALFVNNLTLSFKLYEVAPNVTQYGVPVNMSAVIMNNDTWNKISEADRKTIEEISTEATRRSATFLHGFNDNAIKQLEAAGAKHYTLTADEKKQLIAALETVFDQVAQSGGDLGAQLGKLTKEARGG